MRIISRSNENEISASNVEEVSNSTRKSTFVESTNNAQNDDPSPTLESSNYDSFNVKSEIDVEENFIEASIVFTSLNT